MRKVLISVLCLVALSLQAQRPDTLKVLCLGNSFTYFFDTPKMLAQIAESEGHCLIVRAETVGGYSLCRHHHDLKSLSAIEAGPYDFVFLQDQSQATARYAADRKRFKQFGIDARDLAARIRIYSPEAVIRLEQTWAYEGVGYGGFGSYEQFDALLRKGTKAMAKKAKTDISPIGEAFIICRQERPDIDLYEPDRKHQSALGSYLKSCVNYLKIYNQPFSPNTTHCDLDAGSCAYLRSVAERVVLHK